MRLKSLMIWGAFRIGSRGEHDRIETSRVHTEPQRFGVDGAVDAADSTDAVQREAEAKLDGEELD
jgi:hypothetical protein